MTLNIIKVGDPYADVLRRMSVPVKEFDEITSSMLDGMRSVMIEANGLGLAAPQVGWGLRAIVLADSRWPDLINPVIVQRKGSERRQESCLSIPGATVEVERATKVVVQAQDRTGQPLKIKAQGPLARLLQHEIDHLDGILITSKH